ncbi:MAG: helix-turn-helix transcriptional regulator [Gammaproteobacteria bacterium]|nr:helix-turn-helix transcriptional regulator [Gammaproteobacteria bacterium]
MAEDWTDRAQRELKVKGYENTDVASRLGITEGAVSRLLNDIGEPSFVQLEEIAKMLDMSLSELIGEDAIFVSDKQQIRAVELMQDIGQDRRDLALKVLEALIL